MPDVDRFGVLTAPVFVPEPPPRHRGEFGRADAIRAILPELRERPYQWAVVMRHVEKQRVVSTGALFAAGKLGGRVWHTAIRVDAATGEHVLYARFIPEGESLA